jgi:hypothetical protein
VSPKLGAGSAKLRCVFTPTKQGRKRDSNMSLRLPPDSGTLAGDSLWLCEGRPPMRYSTKRIEVARGQVTVAERSVERQRRKVTQLQKEHCPADDAQARLMIMEQSLLAMVRFLAFLQEDAASEPSTSLSKYETAARIRKLKQSTTP